MTAGGEVSLRELLEQRFAHLEETVSAALLAANTAVLKAEAATEKRFDAVNEFRGVLADQQQLFVRKSEVDYRLEALEKKLDTAVQAISISQGKGLGANAMWGYAVGAIGVLVALIAIFRQ